MATPLIDTWKNARYAALASQIQDAYKKGEELAFSRFYNNNSWDSSAADKARELYGAEQAKEQSNVFNDLSSQAALMELQLAQSNQARADAIAQRAQEQANWEKSFGLGQQQYQSNLDWQKQQAAMQQANWDKTYGLSQQQQAQQQANLDREYQLAIENRDYTRAQQIKAQQQADQEKRQAALNAGWMGDQIKIENAMGGGGGYGIGGGDMATHDARVEAFNNLNKNNPYYQNPNYQLGNYSQVIGASGASGPSGAIAGLPGATWNPNFDWSNAFSGAGGTNGYGPNTFSFPAAKPTASPTNSYSHDLSRGFSASPTPYNAPSMQLPATLASAANFFAPGRAWGQGGITGTKALGTRVY